MLKPHLLPSLGAAVLCFCSLMMLVPAARAGQAAGISHESIPPAEREIISLSAEKWKWMAEKNVERLAVLFDDKAKFVHMSGTWKKAEELEIIKSGSIWYKHAE